jgi:hypothetical protein
MRRCLAAAEKPARFLVATIEAMALGASGTISSPVGSTTVTRGRMVLLLAYTVYMSLLNAGVLVNLTRRLYHAGHVFNRVIFLCRKNKKIIKYYILYRLLAW